MVVECNRKNDTQRYCKLKRHLTVNSEVKGTMHYKGETVPFSHTAYARRLFPWIGTCWRDDIILISVYGSPPPSYQDNQDFSNLKSYLCYLLLQSNHPHKWLQLCSDLWLGMSHNRRCEWCTHAGTRINDAMILVGYVLLEMICCEIPCLTMWNRWG